jgi:hypothetical protein
LHRGPSSDRPTGSIKQIIVEIAPFVEYGGIAAGLRDRVLYVPFTIGGERIFQKHAATIAMLRTIGFPATVEIRPLRESIRVISQFGMLRFDRVIAMRGKIATNAGNAIVTITAL